MSFKQFRKSLNEDKVESELIKTVFISVLTSAITLGILYFTKLKNVEGFIPNYGFFIFFSILSFAIIVPAIKQIRSYKELPCMAGMMVGMSFGRMSGFLPGLFIASTNGMVYGSIGGMTIGIYFGG
jgi:hypothetical protein